MDIARGPGAVLGLVHERFARAARGAGTRSATTCAASASASRARSSSPPGGRSTRRSCPAGTASRSRTGSPSATRRAGARRQRREHHGPGRALGPLARGRAPALVKVGTGIGCGIVADRPIHRGAEGAAGDIGHIRGRPTHDDVVCRCGNTGCLEAVAGGRALAAAAGRRGLRGRATAATSSRLVRDGNAERDPHGPRGRPHARRGARRVRQLLQPARSSCSAATSARSTSTCWPGCARSSSSARCRWPPATCASSPASSATAPA